MTVARKSGSTERDNVATVLRVEHGEPPDRVAKLITTGTRLAIDAGTVEVWRHFEQAGVSALLLKGPSIARWLYAEGELRTYVDCDLLIAPGDVSAAESVLTCLGYQREFDDRKMPWWWREHATAWIRSSDGLTVDLHRTLQGAEVDADTVWRVLSAETDVVLVAGHPVQTLTLPGRALHLALHAAQHGLGWARPMVDLDRALAAGDGDLWARAAALAAGLDADDAFAAGLRLVPAGDELAARLQLSPVLSVDAVLRAGSPPPLALGFEQLARAGGRRMRAEMVWRKLAPPADFVRHWDLRALDGWVGLVKAYIHRPLWILRNAPQGVVAWWRVRRSVRRKRSENSTTPRKG